MRLGYAREETMEKLIGLLREDVTVKRALSNR